MVKLPFVAPNLLQGLEVHLSRTFSSFECWILSKILISQTFVHRWCLFVRCLVWKCQPVALPWSMQLGPCTISICPAHAEATLWYACVWIGISHWKSHIAPGSWILNFVFFSGVILFFSGTSLRRQRFASVVSKRLLPQTYQSHIDVMQHAWKFSQRHL